MPWHLRSITAQDQKEFRNVADLHALTLALRRELSLKLPSPDPTPITDELARLSDPVARRADSETLESMLDDTQAHDVVGRLKAAAWKVHLATNRAILDLKDRGRAMKLASQIAWDEGRTSSRLRWEGLAPSPREDLRAILATFVDSPFERVLVRRAISSEADLELTHCPHSSSPAPGVESESVTARDLLCRIHSSWRQGFAQQTNPRIRVSMTDSAGICIQSWRL